MKLLLNEHIHTVFRLSFSGYSSIGWLDCAEYEVGISIEEQRSMWCPHHHAAHHHEYGTCTAARKWVLELSSLADVIILRCAEILATSVGELQKKYHQEALEFSKVSQKHAVNLLEYCCFKALATAIQNTNFLKDKQFRHLTFEMMLAWESPDSAVMCFKKLGTERENQERKNNEDTALFYSTLIPLLVHQRSTVGKEAFVRIAPAISGVADVLSAHFQFNALARSTGGRLPFRVYDKYLIELDKALDKLRHQRTFRNNFFLDEGENIVEIEETMASGLVVQHVGVSTWPGRLILTDYSLYFEPAAGMMPYGATQKWDLAADLQQIVEPCAVGPWNLPLFDRAICCKSGSNDEHVIFEFPEILGCSRRDYWLMIIQEILYTHQFIRNSLLQGAGQVEAVARSIMSILRFKAIKEALRANPFQPKLLLCFSMVHVSPSGNLLSKILEDKLKKEASLDSRGEALVRRISYAKSATYVLCNSRTSYPKRKRSAEDKKNYVGEFFLDEISHVMSAIAKTCSVWTHVNGSEIILSGEKADNLSVNFSIIKAVFISLRPAILWVNALLSWDEPFKTIAFILIGSSVIMRELLQYVFSFLLVGMATFIIFFKQAGEGPLSGSIDILSSSQSTMEEMLELQTALNGLEELLNTSNIILLRLRALLYSVHPKVTDQVVLCLMVLAGLVTILPAKTLLLLLFLEIFTRKLPLREENSEFYMKRLKAWWSHIPTAPVCFMDKEIGRRGKDMIKDSLVNIGRQKILKGQKTRYTWRDS